MFKINAFYPVYFVKIKTMEFISYLIKSSIYFCVIFTQSVNSSGIFYIDKIEKLLNMGLKPLPEDQDLDYHGLYESLLVTAICWVLLIFIHQFTVYIYDLLTKDTIEDYLDYEYYVGSSPFFLFSEDWDFFNDEDTDDDDLDTYEDDELYNYWGDDAEPDGDEDDTNTDRVLSPPYYENVYNSGEVADEIHWRKPWLPHNYLKERGYFGNNSYTEREFGLGFDTKLYSDYFLFADEPENYFLKYGEFGEEYAPEYQTVPPVNYFYR